jgi:hypothetical protein
MRAESAGRQSRAYSLRQSPNDRCGGGQAGVLQWQPTASTLAKAMQVHKTETAINTGSHAHDLTEPCMQVNRLSSAHTNARMHGSRELTTCTCVPWRCCGAPQMHACRSVHVWGSVYQNTRCKQAKLHLRCGHESTNLDNGNLELYRHGCYARTLVPARALRVQCE